MNAYLLFFITMYVITSTVYGLHRDILELDDGKDGYTLGQFILAVSLNAIVMPFVLTFRFISLMWGKVNWAKDIRIRPDQWFKKKITQAHSTSITVTPSIDPTLTQEYINAITSNIAYYQRNMSRSRLIVDPPPLQAFRRQEIDGTNTIVSDVSRVRPSIRIED